MRNKTKSARLTRDDFSRWETYRFYLWLLNHHKVDKLTTTVRNEAGDNFTQAVERLEGELNNIVALAVDYRQDESLKDLTDEFVRHGLSLIQYEELANKLLRLPRRCD